MSAADNRIPLWPVDPPEAVGVYGITGHTLALLELCRRNWVRVEFVVDDEPERYPGAGQRGWKPDDVRGGVGCRAIPVWPRAEFFGAVSAGRVGVPVFAAGIASEPGQRSADDPFLRAAAEIRAAGAGLPLWHPASLAGAVAVPPCPGRVAIFGFRGSGNVLAQAVVDKLLGGTNPPFPDGAAWPAVFAEHFYLTTANLVRDRLADRVPVADVQFTPEEYPSMFVTVAAADGGMAAAKHVPSNRHVAAPFYWTHSTPSAGALAAFRRLRVPTVAILRHPAETLLALAAKTARPPGPVIDDSAWLDHHAGALGVWMARLWANRRRVHVVRYEDLTARDPGVLRRLAEAVGVRIGPADADKVYDEVLFRDLLPGLAPGHFNRGGSDKWKRHFGRRHREVLVRRGLGELAGAFGYDPIDPAAEAPPAPGPGPARPFPPQYSAAVTHRFFSGPKWDRLPGPVPYLVRATTPALGDALARVLLSDEMRELLAAGGLGTEPPPWCAPIDWDELAGALPLTPDSGADRIAA